MKKGIAVETLVKLMICIIALTILTYLIYRYVLQSGLGERECAARMTAWCVQCKMANSGEEGAWSGGVDMDTELRDCVNEYFNLGAADPQDCTGFESNCRSFLPTINNE